MPLSLAIADPERLLAPITAPAEAGASLRYEGTYDRIREARREDDPSLPQGVWTTKRKVADWPAVARIAAEAIQLRSKDLQLAVWLAEAWAHTDGIAGAAAGVALVTELLERYWDSAFPEPGEGDAEARVGLIDWLDEALAREVRRLPLAPSADGAPAYRLLDWETGAAPDRAAPREDEGEGAVPGASREAFLARASLLGKQLWMDLRKDAGAGIAAAERLETALAGRTPRSPILRRFKDALRAILRLCEAMPGLPREDASAAPASLAPTAGEGRERGGEGGAAPPRAESGPIASRAEAYLRLCEASDYLLRTEPHSPVPYLVKRAVSWGNMSLAELLSEFVSSPDDLVTIQRLLGMRGKE